MTIVMADLGCMVDNITASHVFLINRSVAFSGHPKRQIVTGSWFPIPIKFWISLHAGSGGRRCFILEGLIHQIEL